MKNIFTTNNKLILLLLVVLVGFAALSFLFYQQQQRMKHQLDTLYFGSFIPVKNLQKITHIIEHDIGHEVLTHNIKGLKSALFEINKLWKSYALSYKNAREKKYVYYVDEKLQKFKRYLLNLAQSKQLYDYFSYQKYIRPTLERMTQDIKKLIDYESALAAQQRKEFIQNYQPAQIALYSTIAIVTLITFFLFILISNSISTYQKRLNTMAHELHHLNQELHTQSITDGLTGLYNRRYFDQIFGNEIQRAHREKLPLTFMMLDIDHFKKYNDHYGHAAGDQVIQSVAAHLKKYFQRPSDLVFRLGGEEFGILLHTSQAEPVLRLATEMIEAMKTLNIEHQDSDTMPYVTLSMGLVHYKDAPLMEPTSFYEHTDAKLYEAKEGGRNRVVSEII